MLFCEDASCECMCCVGDGCKVKPNTLLLGSLRSSCRATICRRSFPAQCPPDALGKVDAIYTEPYLKVFAISLVVLLSIGALAVACVFCNVAKMEYCRRRAAAWMARQLAHDDVPLSTFGGAIPTQTPLPALVYTRAAAR